MSIYDFIPVAYKSFSSNIAIHWTVVSENQHLERQSVENFLAVKEKKLSPWNVMRKVLNHFIPTEIREAESVDDLISVLSDSSVHGHSETASWLIKAEAILKADDNPLECELVSQIGLGHNRNDLQLLSLLRECMLTNRWLNALQIVCEIVKEPGEVIHTVWRVGIEIMKHYKEESESTGLLENFINQLRGVGSSNPTEKHIILEECLHLIKENKIDEALGLINHQRLSLRTNQTRSEDMCINLLLGYSGMCNYIEWKKIMNSINKLSVDDDDDGITNYQKKLILEDKCKRNAVDACKNFEEIMQIKGNWDIFMTLYIDITENVMNNDEALAFLIKYSEMNPDNHNALRFIYKHMVTNGYKSNDIISILERIIEKVPSDCLVCRLCELYSEDYELNESSKRRIPILFGFLDYPINEKELDPWFMLSSDLLKLFHGGFDVTFLDEHILPRLLWWPSLYFYVPQLKDFSQLMVYKAIVARLFSDTSDFIQSVLSNSELLEEDKEKIYAIKPIYEQNVE